MIASHERHEFRNAGQEPDLFAVPLEVRARDRDPLPSHEAATLVKKRGTANAQGLRILELLQGHPEGLTAAAIDAVLFPEDRNVVACKRLPELERRDLVARTTERRLTPSGVRATVWQATR